MIEEETNGIPSKFILHVSKCGTDVESTPFSFEHDNPVILGLKGIDQMCVRLTKNKPFLQYLLVCGLLRGLKGFDKERLFNDVRNLPEIIKSLSLKELKGGSEDGRP